MRRSYSLPCLTNEWAKGGHRGRAGRHTTSRRLHPQRGSRTAALLALVGLSSSVAGAGVTIPVTTVGGTVGVIGTTETGSRGEVVVVGTNDLAMVVAVVAMTVVDLVGMTTAMPQEVGTRAALVTHVTKEGGHPCHLAHHRMRAGWDSRRAGHGEMQVRVRASLDGTSTALLVALALPPLDRAWARAWEVPQSAPWTGSHLHHSRHRDWHGEEHSRKNPLLKHRLCL
jgi:hypothetical protein